eukprot:CAMPEP_0194300984 /NCGR_PEP_ID=MMETSP0169-20130528/61555_1 /TAXON_ID=218684 /ORGANISM="Corethron pennatum, Strain L29A3" /LENGTH=280 /DNA_ID=CAMNT_0039051207 /DNA_START=111 /DNA_END=953 /DNA_ORIENTATION=+
MRTFSPPLRIALLLLFATCLSRSSAFSEPLPVSVTSVKDGLLTTLHLEDEDVGTSPSTASPTLKKRSRSGAAAVIQKTLLPAGFPRATPPGYLQYAAWSCAQDLSTQLRSVLATQRILIGMGVGNAEATALSASLNFLMRDGAGMAAGLLFTGAAAGRFRYDVKRWRLFADCAVDAGITMEVLAGGSGRGAMFLPLICIGSVCKAMCGVAAGACGGAINLYWAKGSDISDINAKFGAQNTVTGSLGLIAAAIFAKSISSCRAPILWSLYSALTVLHIYGR